MCNNNADIALDSYRDCIGKQLEELDLLASIYCAPGELKLNDPGVVSDFTDFLNARVQQLQMLESKLDYNIQLSILHADKTHKLDVHIELPHLYPLIEHAIVTIHTPLLSKAREQCLKSDIETFIANVDKQDCYVFQVCSWIQEQIESMVNSEGDVPTEEAAADDAIDCERLWIYLHHIKAKTKRQEIVKTARDLNLTGFSRPGKPGVICVEGEYSNTQEFWRYIKTMRWQKITLNKSEKTRKTREKILQWRRFDTFKEQLFSEDPDEHEECVMDMRAFIKFLEAHNSGYMKKELFGLD